MAKKSKKVSFENSSKIVEISEEEITTTTTTTSGDFDSDNLNIDLTTGKLKKNLKASEEDINVPTLPPSALNIPYHLPFVLFSIFLHGEILEDVRIGLQQSFFGLSILALLYSIILSEQVKHENNPTAVTTGPTSIEFLYTSLTFPISIAFAIPIYGSFILLGAPTGPLNAMTFYLATHVALITIFPLLNVYKITDKNAKKIWWKLLTFQVDNWKFNQVYCITIGGLLGCWLGVIPIPLDWDRDWQDWPITLLFGAYVGGFFGGLLSYWYATWARRGLTNRA